MKNIRLILICLHVLITIFILYNLHPHLSLSENSLNHDKQISTLIGYINDLFRISLYHSSCIIAIKYSRRYGAGMIRATGILLIGELLQVITIIVQHALETHRIGVEELISNVLNVWLLLAGILITFILANKIAKHQKDLMQLELLTTTSDEASMGVRGGEFSLV